MGFFGPPLDRGRGPAPAVPDRARGLKPPEVGGRLDDRTDALRAPDVGLSLLGTRAFGGE
jgi:hypothetical protein